MSQQLVITTPANTQRGDSPKSAFDKINENFSEIYASGLVPFPQLPAEAGLTIIPAFPYGDVRRYGVVPNNSGAAATNSIALQQLWNPSVAGPTGNFYFTNTTGADVYSFSDVIPIRPGVSIDLQECTINYTALGTAADSNSGLFLAIRDFELKNGSIVVNYTTINTSTSAGYAICLGVRGTDTVKWPVAVFDSTTVQGQCRLAKLRITSNITGPQVVSAGTIQGTGGGFNNLVMEDIYLVGSGNGGAQQPITYEFGWATQGTGNVTSTRQSSHAHNIQLRNIDISNYDNVSSSSGCYFTGAYGVSIDGFKVNGISTPINLTAGEATNFRPWVGIDDVGVKRNISIKNFIAQNFSNVAIQADGTNGVAGGGVSIGTGYLHLSWVAGATYVVNQTATNLVLGSLVGGAAYTNGTYNNVPLTGGGGTGALATVVVAGGAVTSVSYIGGAANYAIGNVLSVAAANIGGTGAGFSITISGINWYQVASITTGISAAGVGPTGTGAAIVDGGVTWSYIPLTSSTDLYDLTIDGFAMNGTPFAGGQFGIFSKCGRTCIRNGVITGSATGIARGIVCTDEVTNFEIEGVKIFNVGQFGIQLDFGAAIWSPARLKKGSIKNCYIAGNSSASAGNSNAINLAHCDGVMIEECRFGYEAAYSFIDETTSGGAIFISSPTTSNNVKIRNCRVGGAVGGFAFTTAGGPTSSTNSLENCSFNAGGANPITTPVSGLLSSDLTSPSQVIATNGTVGGTAGAIYNTFRCAPAAAITGFILPAGLFQGQVITVINESIAANTMTAAAVGTSNIADGVSCVIAGLTQKTFRFDLANGLWYHS